MDGKAQLGSSFANGPQADVLSWDATIKRTQGISSYFMMNSFLPDFPYSSPKQETWEKKNQLKLLFFKFILLI